MKKKLYISLIVILCLGFIILLFYSYYNVIVFVENSSPTDDCIDIQIMCDDKTLVNDTFYYAQFSPNYKMFIVHVSWGEHLIKVKSNAAAIEKCQSFSFSGKKSYLFVNYENWQMNIPKDKISDTTKTIEILDEKQFRIGLTLKRPGLQ